MPVDQQKDRTHIPDLRELVKMRFREGAPEVFAENARRMAEELIRLANLDAVADQSVRDALASICDEFGKLAAELDELRAEAAAYFGSTWRASDAGVATDDAPTDDSEAQRDAVSDASPGDPSLPDQVEVALDEFIDGSNWHAPEQEPAGRARRWSGPGTRATVNIFVNRSHSLELTFEIIGAADPEVLDGLRLFADGEPIAHELAHRRRGRAVIAAAPGRRGVEVGFDVPFTVAPAQRDPTLRDMRELGICVRQVAVRPLPSAPPATPESDAPFGASRE